MLIQAFQPWRAVLCCALSFAVSAKAAVILQLRVLEGEGVSYRTGTRATRGLTVLVTDESGQPVNMAAVSFRLPDAGASGTFNSGSRTEMVFSGRDGHASVWGMQWNKTPGAVQIRISAVKDQVRAAIVSTLSLSDTAVAQAGGEGVFTATHHGHKWLWLAAIAGGAAAGGAYAMLGAKSTSPSPNPAVAGLSIGAPTITVGHP